MPSAASQAPILSPQRVDAPSRCVSGSGETETSHFEVLLTAGTGTATHWPSPEAGGANRVPGDFAVPAQSGEVAAAIDPPDAPTTSGNDEAARTFGGSGAGAASAVALWAGVAASPPAGIPEGIVAASTPPAGIPEGIVAASTPPAGIPEGIVAASTPPAGIPEGIVAANTPPDASAGEHSIPDMAEASGGRPAGNAETAPGPQAVTAALPPVAAAAPAEAMHAQPGAGAAPAGGAGNYAPVAGDTPQAELPEPIRPNLRRSAGDAMPLVVTRQSGEARRQADVPDAGKPRGEVGLSGSGSGRIGEGSNAETFDAAIDATVTPGAPGGRSADRQRAPGGDASAHHQSAEGVRAADHAAVAFARDSHGVPRFEPPSLPGAAHQPFAHANPIGALAGLSGPAAAVNVSPPRTAPVPHADLNVPLAGLAVEIAARALEGKRRFEIRLDPPELGRIDVRLDVARDGQVTSRLVVERAETLDLLRRDAPALERALQSAGLRTDDSGLQFSLRDHSGGQRPVPEHVPRPNVLIVPDEDVAVREAVRRGYGILRGLGRGIDIRV